MMKSCSDLMRMIKSAEGMTRMVQLYGSREGEVARQMERYMLLLKRHEDLFGTKNAPTGQRSRTHRAVRQPHRP